MSWIRFASQEFRVESLRAKLGLFAPSSGRRFHWCGKNSPEAVGFLMAARESEKWLSVGQRESRSPPDFGGLILATSGSTGGEKSCRLPFHMIDENAKWAVQLLDLNESSHVVVSSSLKHTAGWNTLLIPALSVGANVTMLEHFDPYAVVALMESDREKKIFHFSPAQADMVQRTKNWRTINPSPGTLVVIGSTDVHPRLIREFCGKGVEVIRNYGLTEAGPYVFSKRSLPSDAGELESLGDPAPSFEFRLESFPDSCLYKMYLRGPAVFDGYCGDANRMEWLDTGDLVSRSGGKLFFQCRARDVLRYEHGHVIPNAVERELLQRHPKAWDVAVLPSAIAPTKRLTVAVVGTSEACELRRIRASANEILSFCRCEIDVINVRKLPRTAAGKIVRQVNERI